MNSSLGSDNDKRGTAALDLFNRLSDHQQDAVIALVDKILLTINPDSLHRASSKAELLLAQQADI